MNNGYKFNELGEMVPIDVYIVWGSPASGKTTYVKNHMEDGDLVIDLDLIKQSLSMKEKTATGDNLLPIALKVRELLYDIIRARDLNCNSVWVIGGLPDADERIALANRLNTDKLIYIEATMEQCIERAMNDDERKDKDIQIRIIEKWFKRFYSDF